ncbi:hypothetical protein ACOMHN_023824 [Nucella lapillus]
MANAAVFPTAALLCKYGFAGGWPAVFYVYGLLGLVWCVVWMAVVSDSPETSGWIHPEERDYIVTHRGQVTEAKEKIKVPWCSIFSSMAFWAIVAAHMTFTWGLFLFMSNLPLYMYEVMNFDIKSNGFYSMLPYLALFFVQLTAGFLADFLSGHHVMTVFWVRRFVTILASLVPAVSLIIMSYLDCTHVAAVVSLLVISVGFMGFAFAGFLVNAFDIAPRYAVSITSVTNSFACIPGIVTPYLVAEVTKDQTGEQWQIIFFITGGVYLCGTLFFCLFAKTSLQPWAQTHHLTVQPLNPVSHPSKSGCIHPENSGCQHLEKSGAISTRENPDAAFRKTLSAKSTRKTPGAAWKNLTVTIRKTVTILKNLGGPTRKTVPILKIVPYQKNVPKWKTVPILKIVLFQKNVPSRKNVSKRKIVTTTQKTLGVYTLKTLGVYTLKTLGVSTLKIPGVTTREIVNVYV